MKKTFSLVSFFTLLYFSPFAQSVNQAENPEKIVGGQVADPNAYPWVVQLYLDNTFPICGASLVAPNWVITAGHCVQMTAPNKVRLNPHSSTNPQASTEIIDIEQIFVFPGFDIGSTTYHPDVSLIKLTTPAQSHPAIPIMNQATDLNLIDAGDWCKVLGWGSTDQSGTQSDLMKESAMEIISPNFCQTAYPGTSMYEQDSTICAGYLSGQTAVGAGSGDSGGPLFVLKNGEPLLIGVVSGGGSIITTDELPGIYTKLYMVRDWIQATMNQSANVNELVQEHVQIYFNGHEIVLNSKMQLLEDVSFELYDIQGNRIQSEKTQLEVGEKHFGINQTLVNGIYFVTLQGSNFQSTQKISVFH